jgi:hypothetical protein
LYVKGLIAGTAKTFVGQAALIAAVPHHESACGKGLLRALEDFTSGVYRATALDAAFPQEKTHFATLACAE